MTTRTVYKREEIAELAYREMRGIIPDAIIEKCIKKVVQMSKFKFIHEIRKATHLTVCAFGNDKFYIKYE
jgi:hypothetical protein